MNAVRLDLCGSGNRTARSFVSSFRMRHGRGLAATVMTGLAGVGSIAWSSTAEACGMSAIGAGAVAAALQALLLVFLLSLVGLLSMRGAARALGRMSERRPSRGLRTARIAAQVGFGVSVLATVLSGGLLAVLMLA